MSLAVSIAGGIILAIFGLIALGVALVIVGNVIHALIIEPRQHAKHSSRQLHDEKMQKEIENYYKTATHEQMKNYLEGEKNPRWFHFGHIVFKCAVKRLEELKMK